MTDYKIAPGPSKGGINPTPTIDRPPPPPPQTRNSMNELYYFGCLHQSGHYLFEHDEKTGHVISSRYPSNDLSDRFGRAGERLDGMFCPPKPWGTQLWIESVVAQWRIISWHDNSVDHRGGSHSTFVGRGYANAEEMLADAKVRFKEVFARQTEVKKG